MCPHTQSQRDATTHDSASGMPCMKLVHGEWTALNLTKKIGGIIALPKNAQNLARQREFIPLLFEAADLLKPGSTCSPSVPYIASRCWASQIDVNIPVGLHIGNIFNISF